MLCNSLFNLNPAYAGSNAALRGQASYQNLQPNLSNNKVTYNFGCDGYLKAFNAGLGVSVQNNVLARGALTANSITFVYAQHLLLFNKQLKLIPSVAISYFQRRLDLGAVTFGDALDPEWGIVWANRATVPTPVKSGQDAHVGLLTSYKRFNAGVSIKHINSPDIGHAGVYHLPTEFIYHLAYTFAIDDKNLIQFTEVFRYQGAYRQGWLMANAIFNKYWVLGLGCGTDNGVLLNVGVRGKHIQAVIGHIRSYLDLHDAQAWQLTLTTSLAKKERSGEPVAPEAW